MAEVGAPGFLDFYWESELKDPLAVKTCELKYNYDTQNFNSMLFFPN